MQWKSGTSRALIATFCGTVLLSACTLGIGSGSVTEILVRERIKLPTSAEVLPTFREKLVLKKVLAAFDLPEDYAELSVFDRREKNAVAGAVRHLYVSTGLLQDFRLGTLPEAQFVAVLTHEVAHMVLDHPMQAASNLRLAINYENDSSTLIDRVVAMAITRMAKPDATAFDMAQSSSRANIMSQSSGALPSMLVSPKELVPIQLFPLYSYPLGKEQEADAMGNKILVKLGYPSGALVPFLEQQLEYLRGEDDQNFVQLLHKRIERLNRP